MDYNNPSTRFKHEPAFIKQEPGLRIKPEFEPSLESIPMAPPVKNEFKDDQKPSIVDRKNLQSGRHAGHRVGGRRYRGPGYIRHRDGCYDFKARYDRLKRKVTFTITHNCRDRGWGELEEAVDAVFEKLRRAHFNIEPIEKPAYWLCQDYWDGAIGTERFSLRVREILSPSMQSTPSQPASQAYKTEEKQYGPQEIPFGVSYIVESTLSQAKQSLAHSVASIEQAEDVCSAVEEEGVPSDSGSLESWPTDINQDGNPTESKPDSLPSTSLHGVQ